MTTVRMTTTGRSHVSVGHDAEAVDLRLEAVVAPVMHRLVEKSDTLLLQRRYQVKVA